MAPKDVNAILNRAGVYFDLERYEDTLGDMERCFELTGGRGNSGRWLQALALQRLGRDDEAIEALDLGIADDPAVAVAHRRKASSCSRWVGWTRCAPLRLARSRSRRENRRRTS